MTLAESGCAAILRPSSTSSKATRWLISDWIGQMKGSSSHYINHRIANRHLLDWQTGYGVVSFGTGDLPWVISYVRNQKQRHAKGTTQERLERGDAEAVPLSPLKRALRGLQEMPMDQP